MQLRLPNAPPEDVQLPYFSIIINREGKAMEIGGGFFDTSDPDALAQLMDVALATGSPIGVLEEYNLRFILRELPMGRCLVFADMTSEQAALRSMIRTFLGLGAAAFLVFLGISALLARWAVRPVARAWEQQKQFIADASHELKTPLTVVMTDAELLHAPDCPESDRLPLSNSILTMSHQMRGLVESLLDLARMDNGSLKNEFRPACFGDILSDAAMLFEPIFYEKGLSLRYEIDPEIQVSGISAHLTQLASILLDNAGKYSSP